ncbi:MAG TPA: hypothetical protein VHD31_02475 [Candidatus Paceibacterota bacterium]|nr:hypothetical protein [Candidatus Paceibacterota bacterium]
MTFTYPQSLEINWALEEFSKRKDDLIKSFQNIGRKYEDKLIEKGFNIAAFSVATQGTEELLKVILYGYITKAKILKIRKEADPFDKVKMDDLEEETLGNLIKLLRIFIGGAPLINQLWKFNNRRIEAIHRLFREEDLTKLEAEFGEYTQSKEVGDMSTNLIAELNKIDSQIHNLAADK